MGYQTIANVLKVLLTKCQTPHAATIRLWIIRAGCYVLQKPIEKADDWVAIGDLTIDIGKVKCLSIIGLQMSHLEERTNYILSHEDVVLLGLHPTEKSTGEFNFASFKETLKENDFQAIVIDQGADIKKGACLFSEQNPKTKIIYDIPHKLSLILEHELKDDIEWKNYTRKLTQTSRLVAQTELAALKPGNQRSKARFMDIGYLVRWPSRILQVKEQGNLDSVEKDRYQKYFGWIQDYKLITDMFEFMVEVIDFVKDVIRRFGLSSETFEYIKMFFQLADSTDHERLKSFIRKVILTLEEECHKLNEGQVVIASTEVLESIFGKFKAIINHGHQGITSNVLGIALLVGKAYTVLEVKQAMEGCSVKSVKEWVKKKIGTTLGSWRYRYFKRTKFDSHLNPVFNA